jgi:release factor glutamine methyltransferase
MVESELLFTNLLNCSRDKLYLNKNRILKQEQGCFLANALSRRSLGEPIQYILGKTEFMGLNFRLTPDVFIPRPETEILVEAVIDYAYRLSPFASDILELGTGSGCIAISLIKYLPHFNITATDISQEALKIAQQNAEINNVANRITFVESDLFESLPIPDMQYAICVCNPPYIATSEIGNLEPELSYEPGIALDGGRGGLDFYRRIIQKAAMYLRQEGYLVLEIGFNQLTAIKEIFWSIERFKIFEVIKDYNNIDRVIIARYG